MELIDHLNAVIAQNSSYVQTQLAKEDLVRVGKLIDLAKEHDSREMMEKAGLYIGWTKGDFRTHEIAEPIKKLMAEIYDYEKFGAAPDRETRILNIWREFSALRMKTLIHCL